MSNQQSRNKNTEKLGVKKTRRNQFLKVLTVNEEIQEVVEKKKRREEEFFLTVTELMKNRKR
ncbi:MAG: hypothetical protein NT098_00975 [Candidatus Parcubacteria bacterium]|nr:hypothetical protein [Candidatus Parcubacteria bacterium]